MAEQFYLRSLDITYVYHSVSFVHLQVVQASNDEKAHLQVSQVTRQDSGLYEARVQNELGFDVSAFSVCVLGNWTNHSLFMLTTDVCLINGIGLCIIYAKRTLSDVCLDFICSSIYSSSFALIFSFHAVDYSYYPSAFLRFYINILHRIFTDRFSDSGRAIVGVCVSACVCRQ